MDERQRIVVCMTSVEQIRTMLRSSPQDWRDYVNLARSIIRQLDNTTFMEETSRTAEQTLMIDTLQRLAHVDPDNGGEPDFSAWCLRQWLAIVSREPQNVAALQGIGQSWLFRAQPTLARIHRVDGSSSSSGDSPSRSVSSAGPALDEDRQARIAAAQAEQRAGTADYVEARGMLHPATEYLDRAVAAAQAQHALSGKLLASAAEAYMSLGNSSSPRDSERHFRRALQLLRAAMATPGYTLNRYLQQFLDDYGRLTE